MDESFYKLGHRGQVRRLKRLGEAALAEYPVCIVRLTPLMHEENTTFRAEDVNGGRYVLRITRPGKNTLESVRSEMAWLAAVRRDTSLGVPEPIPTRHGELAQMVAVEGVPEARICVLFRWVEGRFLDGRLTPRHLERVGAFTARLHDHAARFTPPAGFSRGQVDRVDGEWEADALRRVGEARPIEDVETMRATIQRIRAVMEPLGQGPDVFTLIHADLHQWNYLFHRGEVCAIDFDDCAYGHHLYDLSVTLYELQERANLAALRAALLAGYRTVRPLPVHHEAALPAFLTLRRIHKILWRVDSRDHPAFRDWWQGQVSDSIGTLRMEMRTQI